MAEAFTGPEIGGDHFRSSAVFLTQSHPKQTQGSDIFIGTSLDQLHAQRFGRETVLPSLELCIEGIDRLRMDRYLDHVREVERRIQMVEGYNNSGETRELPDAPPGVPDS